MKVKKILICSNAYPPHFIGGAELIAHQHAHVLKRLGYDVSVFAGELNNRSRQYQLKHDTFESIPVHRVMLHHRDFSGDFINFYNKKIDDLFGNLIADIMPDVVHFHNVGGLSVGLFRAAKSRGIRTILTLHDYWAICYKNTFLKYDYTICDGDVVSCYECRTSVSGGGWTNIPIHLRKDFIFSQFDYIDVFISPSVYLAERYMHAGVEPEKMQVLANGIDIERFSSIQRRKPAEPLRFSYIGYLGRHKGVFTLIEALPQIGAERKYQVNIVGDGEEKGELENQVKNLELKDRVRFWGKVSHNEIERVFKETDVLILPSIWPENQPVSITEAMAARIPVIASRIGGIPELVDDGMTGYLFAPGNAHDLAKKMNRCIYAADNLQVMGENGYKKISAYTVENQVRLIAQLYEQREIKPPREHDQRKNIVCIGKNVHPDCVLATDIFVKEGGSDYRFIMLDWAGESELRKAILLWVVDAAVSSKELIPVMKKKLPLLVPESNEALKSICRVGQCGLFYSNTYETIECLKFLTKNIAIALEMGCNAYRYVL
jgi:glycosyltransferase involved in cell wall biosynthesis